jgi:hypothetical protein
MISLPPSLLLAVAVLAVNVMSLLDAISTFLLAENDTFVELNPVMQALLEGNYVDFLVVKLGVTLVGTVVCWHCYASSAHARTGLKIISRAYCTVLVWHALLLTGLIK